MFHDKIHQKSEDFYPSIFRSSNYALTYVLKLELIRERRVVLRSTRQFQSYFVQGVGGWANLIMER
jgi:hypothetical protein